MKHIYPHKTTQNKQVLPPSLKNILFLHNSLETGGAEQLRYTLLKNLDRNQYSIRLCCINKRGHYGDKIQELGYPVDELNLDHNPKNIFTTFKIFKYIKKQKIDILHTSLFNAKFHGLIASFFYHIPFIVAEEHGEHFQENFRNRGIKFFPYIVANLILSFIADMVICCSKAVREDLIKRHFLPSKKLITISNCIDPANYKVKTDKEVIGKEFKILKEMVFITVSNLSKLKGHKYLIESFSELKKKGLSFKCFFAGEGPLKKDLKKTCQKFNLNDDIVFLGNVQNVADYLNASDVFVLPSLSEGLSISLMEAMYAQLPCIVTDVGSNTELITNKENGIVIKPSDKHQLINALLYCFRNREKLKEFGLRNETMIKKRYLINNYIKKFCDIWDKA